MWLTVTRWPADREEGRWVRRAVLLSVNLNNKAGSEAMLRRSCQYIYRQTKQRILVSSSFIKRGESQIWVFITESALWCRESEALSEVTSAVTHSWWSGVPRSVGRTPLSSAGGAVLQSAGGPAAPSSCSPRCRTESGSSDAETPGEPMSQRLQQIPLLSFWWQSLRDGLYKILVLNHRGRVCAP